MTTAEKGRNNNFDFLRLTGALFVLLSHSFPLSGIQLDVLQQVSPNPSMSFGELGVLIFFTISGYLITKSWVEKPNVVRFLWNRVLRILPALAVVVLLSALVLGPIVSSDSVAQYFSQRHEIVLYFNNIILKVDYNLPGVFLRNPTSAVNGSIWTLPTEFTMYLVVLSLGFFLGLKKRRWIFIPLACASFYFFIASYYQMDVNIFAEVGRRLSENSVSRLGLAWLSDFGAPASWTEFVVIFLVGGLFYLYSDRVVYNRLLFAAISVIEIASFATPYVHIVTIVCLPYMVLYIAFRPSNTLQLASKHGDLSYGVYLYAYVVQQTLLNYLPLYHQPYLLFLSALPITLCCAYFSWHVVESRALKLKKLRPTDLLSMFKSRLEARRSSPVSSTDR